MRIPISTRLAIQHSDARLGAKVRQIRELEVLKEELARTIKWLTAAITSSSARRADDLVAVPGGLDRPRDPGHSSVFDVERQHKQERTWARVIQMAAELDGPARQAVVDRMAAAGLVRLAEAEAHLEQIHRRLDAVDRATRTLITQLGQQVQVAEPAPMPA